MDLYSIESILRRILKCFFFLESTNIIHLNTLKYKNVLLQQRNGRRRRERRRRKRGRRRRRKKRGGRKKSDTKEKKKKVYERNPR